MQKDPANKELVTYSALAIIAEHDNEQIQALRKVHDPAYERWQPHINLCFPFVNPDCFDEAFDVLQEEFKDFKSFEIKFRKMDFFPHGTVFLNPEPQCQKLIQQVYNKIVKVLPHCKGNKDFHPHMTVGKFTKQNVGQKHQELQQNWKQWTFKCEGLHMIKRGKNTPFQTAKFVKFLG